MNKITKYSDGNIDSNRAAAKKSKKVHEKFKRKEAFQLNIYIDGKLKMTVAKSNKKCFPKLEQKYRLMFLGMGEVTFKHGESY